MKLLSITQEELANMFCLLLTVSGLTLGIMSLFPVPGMDKVEAKNLGERFFSTGITLGFGVGAAKKGKATLEKMGANNTTGLPKGH